jgi:hypothetical protein
MKLAACFTVFNGLELLEKAVFNALPMVDVLILCFQTTSNTGTVDNGVKTRIYREFNGVKRVFILEFRPDLTVNTKQNEIKKHNLMIETAKILGCTHFYLTAVDHFYKQNEFIQMKSVCKKMDYDVTFTNMYTYYKHPTYQLTPIENYSMPFICKLYKDTEVGRVAGFPVRVDPSVQINTFTNWVLFSEGEIMLHHYSMIREDIRNKFNNAAASIRWTQEMKDRFISEYENHDIKFNPGIEYFQGRKIKVVDNFFNV